MSPREAERCLAGSRRLVFAPENARHRQAHQGSRCRRRHEDQCWRASDLEQQRGECFRILRDAGKTFDQVSAKLTPLTPNDLLLPPHGRRAIPASRACSRMVSVQLALRDRSSAQSAISSTTAVAPVARSILANSSLRLSCACASHACSQFRIRPHPFDKKIHKRPHLRREQRSMRIKSVHW
jgi:hypothetical protein